MARVPMGDISNSNGEQDPITQWLAAVEGGDASAKEALFRAVYDHLRLLAHAQRRRWNGNNTMGTTALINEAYLKLATPRGFDTRAHFFATASKAMRQILVSYAEKQNAERRGGEKLHLSIDDVSLSSGRSADELLDIERLLLQLEADDPRRGMIVECRLFGGMTIAETAAALGVSPATVKREWRLCTAWLTQGLTR
ncbi:MAG: ECF-type sigma factor [Pseudomonadales bacterium]